ncbi:MAG: diadenylate cyclase [Corallococcus sp.]|nr:diadenylate cyclase [Corallococcus sp.]
MAEYIRKFFESADPLYYIGVALEFLFVYYLYYVVFRYAKKRNLSWLVYFEMLTVVALFGCAFLNVPNYRFCVYFIFCAITLINVVMFSEDFRRDLFRRSWKKHAKDDNALILGRDDLAKAAREIVRACQHMSKSNTGALILIADNLSDSILESGTKISAGVTSELLETLFFPRTPLHDGAVVISANTVVAAGCYLPLTQNIALPREFGTRHRAAIGISEVVPSLTAIVVSEETGIISAMHDGKIKRYLDADMLNRILENAFRMTGRDEEETIWGGSIE